MFHLRTNQFPQMKKLILLALIGTLVQSCYAQENILVLEPTQSMCITGKGAGQDAAINPFSDRDCYALVQNLGENNLTARVQQNGQIIQMIKVLPDENRRVMLKQGHELYFDCEGNTKAQVDFKQSKP